jgi:hypothetical protein
MPPSKEEKKLVLPQGSEIGIFLKSVPENTYGVDLSKVGNPDGQIILLEDLFMKSGGERNRLRASDAKANLILQTPTFTGIAFEAVACGVEPDAVEIKGNKLIVKVKSLNDALTVANNRLKPQRKHSGRAYSYMALIYNGLCYSIEAIRKKVEEGKWEFPPS